MSNIWVEVLIKHAVIKAEFLEEELRAAKSEDDIIQKFLRLSRAWGHAKSIHDAVDEVMDTLEPEYDIARDYP